MDTQQGTGGSMGAERMDSRRQQRKRLKITHHRQSKGESGDGSNVKRNPFLIDLVLEKVFSYSRHVDPDNFKNYRLVCKLWDGEVLKLWRPDTQMNLSRIVAPYPEGLGWTDESRHSSNGGSGYQTPYPFQNVVVTGTCENLMDPQLARWFETEGSKVKQLQFSSRLTCYHHARFLECVLKNWCPNLTQLSLIGVDCISTLVNDSRFVDPGDIICMNLNELILSEVTRTEGAMPNDCQEHLPETYLTSDVLDLERGRRDHEGHGTELGHAIMTIICDTRPIMDFLTTAGDTHDDAVVAMRNLEINNGGSLVPPTHQQAIQEILQLTDGGVLGQLLKSVPMTKLGLRKVDRMLFLFQLFPLLYCRQNTTRQTLSELRIREEDHGDNWDAYFMFSLRLIRTMRFPLVTLKIGPLWAGTIQVELFNFVRSFSETLEHLAIKGKIIAHNCRDFGILNLPLLPKLKSFLNEDASGYRLAAFDFLGSSMRNLERCEMLVQSNSNPQEVEEMTRGMFDRSAFEGGVHPLKVLKTNLPVSRGDHMELMTNWFPDLVKVDLVLIGGPVVDAFFRMTNHLPLQDVKVSFQLSDNGNGDYENVIVENMSQNENLQFLQLVHFQDWPAPFSERAFEQGFAKAPKLTSLKLANVHVLASKHRVREWLSHISCVQLTKVTFQRRQQIDDVDFSFGRSHS